MNFAYSFCLYNYNTVTFITFVVLYSVNQKFEVYLLKRIVLPEDIAGSATLLGNIYVILRNVCKVLCYAGCRPYRIKLKDSREIRDMNPIDIATNYACVCVYILDGGQHCIWRIRSGVEPKRVFKFSEQNNLVSMSVTESGRIAVIWNRKNISVYSDAGEKLMSTEIQETDEVKSITHAIEAKGGGFFGCDGKRLFKLSEDGEVDKNGKYTSTGGSYILRNDNGNIIAVDTHEHLVRLFDVDTFELKNTLLTIERDGVECPRHAHFALDTGQFLVSWLNYLDVYSFSETEQRSHLAASEQETREQQVAERLVLEIEVSKNKHYKELVHVADEHCSGKHIFSCNAIAIQFFVVLSYFCDCLVVCQFIQYRHEHNFTRIVFAWWRPHLFI